MPTPARSLAKPEAARRGNRTTTVCVVDPNPTEYTAWNGVAKEHSIKLEIVGSAAAALRLANHERVALWVINAELPDLAGGDLCQMLRGRDGQAPIYAVSNSYSADFERQAYQSGAQIYGAKPAHRDWLSQWQMHRESKFVAPLPNLASRGN